MYIQEFRSYLIFDHEPPPTVRSFAPEMHTCEVPVRETSSRNVIRSFGQKHWNSSCKKVRVEEQFTRVQHTWRRFEVEFEFSSSVVIDIYQNLNMFDSIDLVTRSSAAVCLKCYERSWSHPERKPADVTLIDSSHNNSSRWLNLTERVYWLCKLILMGQETRSLLFWWWEKHQEDRIQSVSWIGNQHHFFSSLCFQPEVKSPMCKQSDAVRLSMSNRFWKNMNHHMIWFMMDEHTWPQAAGQLYQQPKEPQPKFLYDLTCICCANQWLRSFDLYKFRWNMQRLWLKHISLRTRGTCHVVLQLRSTGCRSNWHIHHSYNYHLKLPHSLMPRHKSHPSPGVLLLLPDVVLLVSVSSVLLLSSHRQEDPRTHCRCRCVDCWKTMLQPLFRRRLVHPSIGLLRE